MAQLIVVGFKNDMYRASQALNQLSAMDDDWAVDLHDAVAVYRDENGKLRVDQSYQPTTAEGAGWGLLWGSLIGLTLAAIPFTAGASAAAGAALVAGAVGGGALGAGAGALDAAWWKDEFGIPQDFVDQVSSAVQPGDSAIFALLRTADPAYVADQFRGMGGIVLQTNLTDQQTQQIQEVLSGRR